jgi:uncharacterized protein (DUF2141 family)
MKARFSLLRLQAVLLLPALLLTACNKDPVITDQPTKITGVAKLRPGTQGDISNAQVAIYMSQDDWDNYNPVLIADVSGTTSKITYTFDDVLPGNYYLDVWVDNDRDGSWSVDDIVGWYGSGALGSPLLSPFMVTEGKTKKMSDIVCEIL